MIFYNQKELRTYIGTKDIYEYFAPLLSQKLKQRKMKNTINFKKIKEGDGCC